LRENAVVATSADRSAAGRRRRRGVVAAATDAVGIRCAGRSEEVLLLLEHARDVVKKSPAGADSNFISEVKTGRPSRAGEDAGPFLVR